MFVSGALLFYAIPVRTYLNIFFRIKVLMLILAGLNAWFFHFTVYRRVAEWDLEPVTPRGAKVAGALSLLLWAGIVVAANPPEAYGSSAALTLGVCPEYHPLLTPFAIIHKRVASNEPVNLNMLFVM